MNKISLLILHSLMLSIAFAQNDSLDFENADAPYHNVTADSLAVGGYDLVAYFVGKEATKGSEKYEFQFQGIKYRFKNGENKSTFAKNPEKYLPQFGGYCAYGLAMDAEADGYPPGKYPINPKTFKIIDNKLYLFYNEQGYNYLEVWNNNEEQNLLKAHKMWERIHK